LAILLEHGKLLVKFRWRRSAVFIAAKLGESAIFGPTPHAFVRDSIPGALTRQRFRDDFRMLARYGLDEGDLLMKVFDYCQSPTMNHSRVNGPAPLSCPFQASRKKDNHVLGDSRGVVGQQREIKVGRQPVRAGT